MNNKDKLIEKLKELIARIKLFWNVSGIRSLAKLESEIASLDSELAKEEEPEVYINTPFFGNSGVKVPIEEPEGVKAEEILRNTFMQQYKESFVNEIALKRAVDFIMLSEDNKVALLAMEAYKQINLRDVLIKFADYYNVAPNRWHDGLVDEYLNQKDK